MRNKLFTALLLSLFVMQACVKDDEKVFNASAAERMNAAIQAYKSILCAAPGGWVMEYYPETDRSMGGYNFICKFEDDGAVQIAGEMSTTNYSAGNPATSTYDIITGEGAVLTFNTYNEVLHVFVEPRGSSDIDGYAGDYEFVIRKATPEQIVMIGKKYGNQVVMTPYSGGDATTWKGHLEQLSTLYKKMEAPVYAVKVDGTAAAIKRVTRKYRTFQFVYDNPENNKTVPYLMTPTGIKLYEPLTVDGETAQYFTLDTTAEILTSVGSGRPIVIELSTLPPNEFLAETPTYWFFNITKSSSSVQALIATCATNVSKGESEKLSSIIIGQSPLGVAYPGRGLVFKSSAGTKAYNSQFLCDFTPAGNNVDIKYKGEGLNGKFYYTYYKEFLDALTAKSPYSVKVDNPKKTAEMTITSVADPAFYFIIAL